VYTSVNITIHILFAHAKPWMHSENLFASICFRQPVVVDPSSSDSFASKGLQCFKIFFT